MASHDKGSGALGGEALLAVWETLTGIALAPQQREAFLARKELPALTSKSVAALVAAAESVRSPGRLRLDDWLHAIEAPKAQPSRLKDAPTSTGGYLSGPHRPDVDRAQHAGDYRGLRSRDGRFPQRPLDNDLHKLMPRPQRYDDTF